MLTEGFMHLQGTREYAIKSAEKTKKLVVVNHQIPLNANKCGPPLLHGYEGEPWNLLHCLQKRNVLEQSSGVESSNLKNVSLLFRWLSMVPEKLW